jgi:hypothetical protein
MKLFDILWNDIGQNIFFSVLVYVKLWQAYGKKYWCLHTKSTLYGNTFLNGYKLLSWYFSISFLNFSKFDSMSLIYILFIYFCIVGRVFLHLSTVSSCFPFAAMQENKTFHVVYIHSLWIFCLIRLSLLLWLSHFCFIFLD